ncbi:MAG: hypothetical protein ACI8QZ_001211 [Chlamydiales bacterium]|jgi:hypothetical protein
MSHVIIFGMGCFVSLIVASAVSLLLWGAAHEPHGETLPSKGNRKPEPQPRPDQNATASAKGLESQSIA